MTETADHPSPAVLRRMSQLGDMPPEELDALSRRLFVREASKGTELLSLGSTDDSLLYLLEGKCRLVAADGGERTISHRDPSALTPLARLRPSRYKIEAGSTAPWCTTA